MPVFFLSATVWNTWKNAMRALFSAAKSFFGLAIALFVFALFFGGLCVFLRYLFPGRGYPGVFRGVYFFYCCVLLDLMRVWRFFV